MAGDEEDGLDPAGTLAPATRGHRMQVLVEVSHAFTLNPRIDADDSDGKKDGYSLVSLKLQYSPFAPKRKKKITLAPVEPNANREEHQEWRTKPKKQPRPAEEENAEEELPLDENAGEEMQEGSEEESWPEEENKEEQPKGENNQEGW
jgi:hypothetical protein